MSEFSLTIPNSRDKGSCVFLVTYCSSLWFCAVTIAAGAMNYAISAILEPFSTVILATIIFYVFASPYALWLALRQRSRAAVVTSLFPMIVVIGVFIEYVGRVNLFATLLTGMFFLTLACSAFAVFSMTRQLMITGVRRLGCGADHND